MKDYACRCGRKQRATISEKIAELIGWRKIDGQWYCPFCTGNQENLWRVFNNKE